MSQSKRGPERITPIGWAEAFVVLKAGGHIRQHGFESLRPRYMVYSHKTTAPGVHVFMGKLRPVSFAVLKRAELIERRPYQKGDRHDYWIAAKPAEGKSK